MRVTGVAALVCAALFSVGAHAATLVDTIDANDGQAGTYFVPNVGDKLSSPYYRWNGQDWGWTHNAIAGPFTTAELNISAFDVDDPQEVDEIWVKDNGVWTYLGSLTGVNNTFSFTTFTLGASLFDEVQAGLEVQLRIDTPNTGWAVSLAKSQLTIDGASVGNPNPTPVPVPAAAFLLLGGLGVLGGVGAARRRKT